MAASAAETKAAEKMIAAREKYRANPSDTTKKAYNKAVGALQDVRKTERGPTTVVTGDSIG